MGYADVYRNFYKPGFAQNGPRYHLHTVDFTAGLCEEQSFFIWAQEDIKYEEVVAKFNVVRAGDVDVSDFVPVAYCNLIAFMDSHLDDFLPTINVLRVEGTSQDEFDLKVAGIPRG